MSNSNNTKRRRIESDPSTDSKQPFHIDRSLFDHIVEKTIHDDFDDFNENLIKDLYPVNESQFITILQRYYKRRAVEKRFLKIPTEIVSIFFKYLDCYKLIELYVHRADVKYQKNILKLCPRDLFAKACKDNLHKHRNKSVVSFWFEENFVTVADISVTSWIESDCFSEEQLSSRMKLFNINDIRAILSYDTRRLSKSLVSKVVEYHKDMIKQSNIPAITIDYWSRHGNYIYVESGSSGRYVNLPWNNTETKKSHNCYFSYGIIQNTMLLINNGFIDKPPANLLFALAKINDLDSIVFLVNEYKMDINTEDKKGKTPLCYFSNVLTKKRLELLVSVGANIHHPKLTKKSKKAIEKFIQK